jgi:hypothetical protein
MKMEYIQKKRSLFNKKVFMQLNLQILEDVVGAKLPNEQENIRAANKLGLLIVMFLLFQFCIVLALVLKVIGI